MPTQFDFDNEGLTKMPIKLNFTGVSTERTFESWPVDEPVKMTIFNITQEVGKDSGAPYLKFEFKQEAGNRKAWRNFSLQAGALWALKKLLVDLGEYDKDELEGDFDFDPADILGKPVLLTFGPETEYNGKPSQQVKDVVAA